ncbi:hypothetical protein MKQ70_00225 [Chitinophaga sedimenti]|uniref:hypothetical protein n=1 Tax=Chitinophaga sedimenti TaxID=2033606 RepID=UPI00200666CD|nr:hypothetical protein [Chitinophaga sedimenti]MCK7553512.1 hypothetical protein [Chitinophaga sedimenti]
MPDLLNILIDSLQHAPGFQRDAFAAVHAEAKQLTSVRLNPARLSTEQQQELLAGFAPITTEKVPWSNTGYYLSSRPSFTFDPLFHAGAYYVQEASSMFWSMR